MMELSPLLELRNITKRYTLGHSGRLGLGERHVVTALAGVSLSIAQGEVLGLVGESGSGKSTLGRIAVGLEQPTAGDVLFNGQKAHRARRRGVDLLALQMIFQNAVASLNPRQRVAEIVAEPIRVHRRDVRDVPEAVASLVHRVGVGSQLMTRYPHQLSGGQCQRIGIARALAAAPRLLVCDEPVSALDVSIQAQILNLFADLKEDAGYSYLFISHDLHVVERLSERVAVMYFGRVVESGPTSTVYSAPKHPYTQALIDAAPRIGRGRRESAPVKGEIPSPLQPPAGCPFHLRCPRVMAVCREIEPKPFVVGKAHWSACHLHAGQPSSQAELTASG